MNQGNQKRYFVNNVNVSQSHISEDYEMKYDESIAHSRHNINSSIPHKSQQQIAPSQFKPQIENSFTSPKLLPQKVFMSIKERYWEVKKFSTDDPDILMEFYMFYRNSGIDAREKAIRELQSKIEGLRRVPLKPDSQAKLNKLEKKLDFQLALTYDPNDIYYTLHHEKKKIDMDKEVNDKMKLAEAEFKKRNQSAAHRRVSDVVMKRLYPQQNNSKLTEKEKEEVEELKFAKKLLDYYEEMEEIEKKDLTVNNLYDMWLGIPDKEKRGYQASKDSVKNYIRQWMRHNIKNLITAHFDKKGIKTDDPSVLYDFLEKMKSQSIHYFEVFIPLKGFTTFYEEYAIAKEKSQEERKANQLRTKNKLEAQQKQIKQKVIKRPVSSTPLSVLAMPKNGNVEEIIELIKKYPHDKNLKRILAEKAIPAIRRPEEYGCHSLEEEIKIKNRVKNDAHKNTDKIIENIILNKTVNLEIQEHASSLMNILNEENLGETQKWIKTSKLLKQALLVELHSEHYLSAALHEFAEAHLKNIQNPSSLDYKVLIEKIMKNFDTNSKNRQNKLSHLKSLIQKVKYEKESKHTEEEKKRKQIERAEKRKFYTYLVEWARVYIQNFIQNKAQNQSRRDFMNQFYAKTLELHKPYLNKHFPIFEQTEGIKSIHSPLLKYQFFKIVKDINPETMQLDHKAKNAAWTPAGKSDGFSTFNRLSTAYYHEPKPPVEPKSPEKDKKKANPSVWEKDKAEERSKFMMKMSDATECTFKPKIYKIV